MLLFDPVYDAVIHKLIKHKGVTTQKLYEYLQKDKCQISLPNLYKIIGRLTDAQILFKEQGKLSLHSRWILEFLSMADQMKKVYLEVDEGRIGTTPGWTKTYTANSIEDLDGIRGDVMLEVNRIYGDKEPSYIYHAHPYYALGMHETEMSFFKQANRLAPVYYITGNTGFLDLHGVKLYNKIGLSAIATDDLPFLKDGYCVNAIGDYVFEVIYPKPISDYFKIFFDSIKTTKDFNEDLFHRIFEMKADCKLTVRYDSTQAKNIAKIFQKAFKKSETALHG